MHERFIPLYLRSQESQPFEHCTISQCFGIAYKTLTISFRISEIASQTVDYMADSSACCRISEKICNSSGFVRDGHFCLS